MRDSQGLDGSWVIFLNAFIDETSTKQLNCTITDDCSESTTERKGNAQGGAVAKWSKALLLISLLKKINENHKKYQGSPRHLKKRTHSIILLVNGSQGLDTWNDRFLPRSVFLIEMFSYCFK